MTFEGLFTDAKDRLIQADVSKFSGTAAFEIRVYGEAAGVFYVEIKDGSISVMPYDYHDRSALITLSGETLAEICSGELDPRIAFAVGRVKVQGDFSKVERFVAFILQ